MISRLIRKLENFAPLSDAEKNALIEASATVRLYGAHEDLCHEGAPSDSIRVILDGLACRYKVLPDGCRQIVAYFVPGDLCDLRSFLLKRMDHSVGTLSPIKAALVSHEQLLNLTERFPRLTRALWWSTLVDEAIAREWVVNVGHRTALQRTAHLFCEIFLRLQAVGLTAGQRCELPITQIELADTLALSAVHVNRTLMDLRRASLITFHGHVLLIHDWPGLQEAAGFDSNYLHLDGENVPAAAAAGRIGF